MVCTPYDLKLNYKEDGRRNVREIADNSGVGIAMALLPCGTKCV